MLEADGGRGKACKCTKLNLNDPHPPHTFFLGTCRKQLKRVTPGIGNRGVGSFFFVVFFGVCFGAAPTSSGTEAAHSAALTSRQTPPSMAKHCPGTVPGGSLDMCVLALVSWADM